MDTTNQFKSVIKLHKGMSSDVTPDLQPNETYRYALNAALETNGDSVTGQGDFNNIHFNNGNEEKFQFPIGYRPIGNCYFNKLNNLECNLVFLTNQSGVGQIGIVYQDSYIELVVNAKLTKLVNCEYRLRKGCKHTFYYTDYYNGINKIVVKDTLQLELNEKLFNDFIEPNITPDVLNSGGLIDTGSYSFALAYLDEDLNTTKFSSNTEFVNVYYQDSSIEYNKIHGSPSGIPTTKSIVLNLTKLDTTYRFYKIAIIKKGGGRGQITSVLLSNPISFNIDTSVFIYNGQIDGYTQSSLSEVNIDPVSLENCKYLEQIDNMLIFLNTKDKKYDLCSFQKFANKIKPYVISPRLPKDNVKLFGNSKNPISSKHFLSGEVYAFGIVYIFKNGTKSPVYHISGQRDNTPNQIIQTWNEQLNHLYSESEYQVLPDEQKLKYFQVYDTSYTEGGRQYFNYYENSTDYPDYRDCTNTRIFPLGKIAHFRFPELKQEKEQYGVKFENIEYPHEDIIGHEFVYAKRTDANKTILDKGIMGTLGEGGGFVGMAWLSPELAYDNKYFISPQFLYENKLPQGDYIHVEGIYLLTKLVPKVNEDFANRGYDAIGSDWSDADYIIETQEHYYDKFQQINKKFKIKSQRLMNYFSNQPFNGNELVNLSLTNKIIAVETEKRIDVLNSSEYNNKLYVSYRVVKDVYSNLFDLDYIKCHSGYFTLTDNQECYGGDIITNELKFENTFFRQSLNGIWRGIATIGIIVVGAALTILSAGTLTPVVAAAVTTLTIAATVIGASISIIAQAAALIISQTAEGRYDNLLIDDDNWDRLDSLFNARGSSYAIYTSEIMHRIYVESTINIDLRIGNIDTCTNFYNHQTNFTAYCKDKILLYDNDNNGYVAKPVLCPEYYKVNYDFSSINDVRIYKAMPITFYNDCCDDCTALHRNRIYWSTQSFESETTDNYKKVLPNNYIDVPSEFGEITGVFKQDNSLFYTTPRGLFALPQRYQERVVGSIVSFLGTGEYFSIPPKKITNDEMATAGTTHPILKTPNGVIIVDSQYGKTIWLYSNKLELITNELSIWFRNNLMLAETLNTDHYYNEGSGVIMSYDYNKNVVYITKRDFVLTDYYRINVINYLFAANGSFVVKDGRYGFKVNNTTIDYISVDDPKYFINKSWTISYNLKKQNWISFHSFVPNYYFNTKSIMYLVLGNIVYKHGIGYKIFGKQYPFIIEFVLNENAVLNKVLNGLSFIMSDSYKHKFFDELIVYNELQSTGVLKITDGRTQSNDFFNSSTRQSDTNIKVTRYENSYFINDLKNFVKTVNIDNLFTSEWIAAFIAKYPIDKVVNANVVTNNNWQQQEPIRSKYMTIRLIYNGSESLTLKYILNDNTYSL